MSDKSRQSSQPGAEPTSTHNADSAPTRQTPPGAAAVPPEKPKANPRRKMLLGAFAVLVLAGALWFGIPWVQTTLNTVSTDDAYVNSHVTFVAARVSGQVALVKVDDNDAVVKDQLIVLLDKEPYQKEVDRKEADLAKANADYADAEAKVQS